MGVVQLSDELLRVVGRRVVDYRGPVRSHASKGAFMRLVDDSSLGKELQHVVKASLADLDANRYTTIATREGERHLWDGMMVRLRTRLPTDASYSELTQRARKATEFLITRKPARDNFLTIFIIATAAVLRAPHIQLRAIQ